MRHFFVFGLVLLSPAFAQADVVMEPPMTCPIGSTPSTAHSGPYCRLAADCTSDSMCTGGATCMPVSQCIETRACGGLSFPDAAPCTIEHVVGPCAGDGTCATGECRARSVCSSTSTEGGCSCRATAPRSRSTAAILLLALAAIVRSRSRR